MPRKGKMDTQSNLQIVDHPASYRSMAIKAIAQFRREWEQHVNGKSLLDINASVGLLLVDIAERMGLTSQERFLLLGYRLNKDANQLLDQPNASELPQ